MSGPPEGPLVFVGGTGRSGTHVLGRLLGRHPQLADVPVESRFHCHGPKGLPDLLGGRVALSDFLWKLREFWWHRVRKEDSEPRGLYNLMTRREFDRCVERFEGAYHQDPLAASRALFADLLWRFADEAGKPGLVEMSSHNVREAQTLRRLFSDARFIHVFRDGRDTASSITTKTWGPQTIVGAIEWWADRLRAIDAGIRSQDDGAGFAIPPGRFHMVLLDDLVSAHREREYQRLVGFLGLGDAAPMREFFDRDMSASAANRGRWREDSSRLGRARVERKYQRTLMALAREGNHVAPALLAAYEAGR